VGPVVKMTGYKLYFADLKVGQVGFYGSLEEHGHPAILDLRLKIEDRKISEMEAIVLRSTARGTFSDVQALKVDPIMTQHLAPSEKRSRDELITASDAYFEGMEKGADKVTPFDPDCKRIENGVVTANDPGNAKQISRINTPFDEPFSFQICELFKVRNGKLLRIEALVAPVPYGMPTGWGGNPSHKQ
jgi:hypothetical protein